MERTIHKVSQTPLGTIWEAGMIVGGRDLPPGVFGLEKGARKLLSLLP